MHPARCAIRNSTIAETILCNQPGMIGYRFKDDPIATKTVITKANAELYTTLSNSSSIIRVSSVFSPSASLLDIRSRTADIYDIRNWNTNIACANNKPPRTPSAETMISEFDSDLFQKTSAKKTASGNKSSKVTYLNAILFWPFGSVGRKTLRYLLIIPLCSFNLITVSSLIFRRPYIFRPIGVHWECFLSP